MVILDASVILKWFMTEEESEIALGFRDRHAIGEEHVIVPSLLFYEVANVLRYNTSLPDEELINLFEILKDLELSAMNPSLPELEETMLYARQKNISVYDASYVILAKRLGCDLITADKRLADHINEPFVRVLQTK